jgi:hypothetical protein
MDDLVRELKELKKLSSVSFVLQKLNEAYEKVTYAAALRYINI